MQIYVSWNSCSWKDRWNCTQLHHTETSLACLTLPSHCYYCVINSNMKVGVGMQDYTETAENVYLEQLMMGFQDNTTIERALAFALEHGDCHLDWLWHVVIGAILYNHITACMWLYALHLKDYECPFLQHVSNVEVGVYIIHTYPQVALVCTQMY